MKAQHSATAAMTLLRRRVDVAQNVMQILMHSLKAVT